LSKAFENDFTLRYIFSHMSEEEKNAYLPDYFRGLLTAAALNNGTFSFLDNDNCCGVLMPPGSKVDNPMTLIPAGFMGMVWKIGLGATWRMLREVATAADEVKAQFFGKSDRYYYVFFIGTNLEARGKGLCSALVRHYQGIAEKEGLPIFLETHTKQGKRIYLKCGFKVVAEELIGQGKCAADGSFLKGGPGLRGWAMIWSPPAST
jgi:ribosomal protein S18 acetylase RimI-like enzyme